MVPSFFLICQKEIHIAKETLQKYFIAKLVVTPIIIFARREICLSEEFWKSLGKKKLPFYIYTLSIDDSLKEALSCLA